MNDGGGGVEGGFEEFLLELVLGCVVVVVGGVGGGGGHNVGEDGGGGLHGAARSEATSLLTISLYVALGLTTLLPPRLPISHLMKYHAKPIAILSALNNHGRLRIVAARNRGRREIAGAAEGVRAGVGGFAGGRGLVRRGSTGVEKWGDWP